MGEKPALPYLCPPMSTSLPHDHITPFKESGKGKKEQVAEMLQRIFGFEEMPKFMDATDGLAVAYCHYLDSTNIIKKQSSLVKKPAKKQSSKNAWSDFVKKNVRF